MRKLSGLALSLALSIPLAAAADTVNLSTGVPPIDGGGGIYTYSYTILPPSAPYGNSIVHGNAVRTGPNAAWMVAPGDIHWISNTGTGGTTNQYQGYWTYTTTFNNPVMEGTLAGWFASDNNMYEVILNGNILPGVSSSGTGTFNRETSFTVTTGFVQGTNTLQFVVYNNGSGPEGLLANVFFTPAPEPSSIILLATGGLALLFFGTRLRRTHVL